MKMTVRVSDCNSNQSMQVEAYSKYGWKANSLLSMKFQATGILL